MNSLELFSGAGGLAKGLELAGARHQAFVEWDRNACNTLRRNFPSQIVHETDIRTFSFADYRNIDLIAGGPPCQPFSLGGKAKGYDDNRDMFPYAVSAIRQLMPKAFIFENVKGLLRKSFARYFNFILLQLTYPEVPLVSPNWKENFSVLERIHTKGLYTGLKYNIVFRLVNAANYGVPQKRERVIIVGIRNDLNVSWSFPEETCSEDALSWDKYVTGDYWNRHDIDPGRQEMLIMEGEKERLLRLYGASKPALKPWLTVRDALDGLPTPLEEALFHPEHIFRKGAREYAGHTGSDIDQPSKTIKAGNHGVPGGENMIKFADGSMRYYTVLEAKRIQTFPDDYPITGSWTEAMRQLGNAVPVKLAQTIANSLFKAMQ